MTKSQSFKIKQIPKLLKAIKMRCLDCSAYNIFELKNCICSDCPLFPFRGGKINNNLQKIPHKIKERLQNG